VLVSAINALLVGVIILGPHVWQAVQGAF
jgi:hypothetical protein